MGRPPQCDKSGMKKGPWSPEEDIILVSYIQDRGPGNWKAVPANTGLMRCSKSCRLRWTNYLRPGIKRGNFSDHEEKLIIHLQALFGNRWAAIASYLPERTDNDIKNYYNTHLKKKLTKKLDESNGNAVDSYQSMPKGEWERKLQTDMRLAKQALCDALSLENINVKPESTSSAASTTTVSSNVYASSVQNISQLLDNWMRSLKPSVGDKEAAGDDHRANSGLSTQHSACNNPEETSMLCSDSASAVLEAESGELREEEEGETPLEMLERWLFDESLGQGQGEDHLVDLQLDEF